MQIITVQSVVLMIFLIKNNIDLFVAIEGMLNGVIFLK